MAAANFDAKHIFGLKPGVAGNVCYHDEQTIVYPSGANCVMYNIDQKTQKFILPTEKSEGMTALAIGPNRRYVAIAEKGEKLVINIYDLHNNRKKRSLVQPPDIKATEYVSLAFSPDSKYLIALTGKPDYTLLYYTWEKSKVLASTKTTNPQTNNPVYQASFNPQDNTQLCVVGNGIFRNFRYSEGNLKAFNFQKMEPQNFLCHAWVSEERVVVGTDTGKLLLFENGEIKNEFNIGASLQDKKQADDDSSIVTIPQVTAIVAYSKGFACACGPGTVHLYEKTDDKDLFKKSKQIKIPQDNFSSYATKAQQQIITCLAISPSEETLVASTDQSQIYHIQLPSADLGKSEGDVVQFETLSQSFHSGQILGVDICIRKPLIATCSLDKSVRIWNYEKCNLELYKEFPEELFSIALHPSGLYILVGFNDKLRLQNLLIDDIRTFKEFNIRGCRECTFSNGGHLFAAVSNNVIQIFSTTTFEDVATLRGHNGKVRSITFSNDDTKLVSCGMEGAVYEWNIFTSKRIRENVEKACSYTGVSVTADNKTIYTVGTDKRIKELADFEVVRNIPVGDISLTTVALSHSGRMLFGGTARGSVWSFKFPLTMPVDGKPTWEEKPGHGMAITKMKITYDDQFLVTVSEDACVMLWKLRDQEARGVSKRDKDIGWTEEILITKSDLEDKNNQMAELKQRVQELQTENEYQLRLKDMSYNEKIKELTEKFIEEMEALKTKNQVLKTEKDKEEARHEEELTEKLEAHSRELQDLESANNQKLMLEYEKFQDMQAKMNRLQEEYDRRLQEKDDSKERALQELTEYFETRVQDMTAKLEQAHDEAQQAAREYEETKKQIEEDSDREILDIKNKYEMALREEKDKHTKLKGEAGITQKKYEGVQKEIKEQKQQIKTIQQENKKHENTIQNMTKEIENQIKEKQERDDTIQDKERRIYDLKKKNQELEKFKFVLDYKIKELRKQILPREEDIKKMKEQIQEMESELERFNKQNTQLELSIKELTQKLKATDKEMHQERQKVRDVEAVVKRFKTDLHNCVGYIQDPKMLKESIKALYSKHVQEDITESASVDADIQKEYSRQREHLERSVASLRKKLAKDSGIHRADNVRIMQENVSLIKEINDLRRELKIARTTIHDLEAAMGLHSKKAKKDPNSVQTISFKAPSVMAEQELEEKNKIIEMQRMEIRRLREEYDSGGSRPPSRPSSNPKLPPMEVA
ncbi:cilia- and flagella-associated protein 57-like [Mytilus galloprovincialis]